MLRSEGVGGVGTRSLLLLTEARGKRQFVNLFFIFFHYFFWHRMFRSYARNTRRERERGAPSHICCCCFPLLLFSLNLENFILFNIEILFFSCAHKTKGGRSRATRIILQYYFHTGLFCWRVGSGADRGGELRRLGTAQDNDTGYSGRE